jgi:hypothetical protein
MLNPKSPPLYSLSSSANVTPRSTASRMSSGQLAHVPWYVASGCLGKQRHGYFDGATSA